MNTVLLKAQGISKSFGSTVALADVDFILRPGEIHGLIGENGSGKSTLSSIIAGSQKADAGAMTYRDSVYAPVSSLDANARGICLLLQEKGTFDGISVAQNIFIGKEKQFEKFGLLSMKKLNQRSRDALDRVGIGHIDERTRTECLSFEDLKLVEIASAMENNPDILIVDETTTALSRQGCEILYRMVRQMRDNDKGVIFISHNIDEVKEICDRLTVLRDGKLIDTLDKSAFTDKIIRQLMVGREISENLYRMDWDASSSEKIALKASAVTGETVTNVDLTVNFGEILGIGGLTGCGMHELGKILFGRQMPISGYVALGDGTKLTSVGMAVKNSVGYVSKDRDKEALMTSASILENICAPSLSKLKNNFGIITLRKERTLAQKWVEVLKIKTNNVKQAVRELSGGNKQKVSVAKWLGFDANIIIFDCPTRGIDIGVKFAIYQLLAELKKTGKAILMISEELAELIGMSDRIVLMKDGQISAEFKHEDNLTELKLIEYII
jgi:ribose transport system ATP-binding protein